VSVVSHGSMRRDDGWLYRLRTFVDPSVGVTLIEPTSSLAPWGMWAIPY
jgi:hypothetical protein